MSSVKSAADAHSCEQAFNPARVPRLVSDARKNADLGVSIVMGVPQIDGLEWNILLKWMIYGTPILGNLHFTNKYIQYGECHQERRCHLREMMLSSE